MLSLPVGSVPRNKAESTDDESQEQGNRIGKRKTEIKKTRADEQIVRGDMMVVHSTATPSAQSWFVCILSFFVLNYSCVYLRLLQIDGSGGVIQDEVVIGAFFLRPPFSIPDAVFDARLICCSLLFGMFTPELVPFNHNTFRFFNLSRDSKYLSWKVVVVQPDDRRDLNA